MRRGTFPMRAKVWHAHLKPRLGKMRRSAEFDPVYKGAGKQTVQKHKRTSFPDDVQAKPRSILASEPVDPCVRCGIFRHSLSIYLLRPVSPRVATRTDHV